MDVNNQNKRTLKVAVVFDFLYVQGIVDYKTESTTPELTQSKNNQDIFNCSKPGAVTLIFFLMPLCKTNACLLNWWVLRKNTLYAASIILKIIDACE